VFISDIRKAQKDLGWSPKISAEKGIELLFNWVKENQTIFN
jgi:nucleoside-diphosphate-sugar epimerase